VPKPQPRRKAKKSKKPEETPEDDESSAPASDETAAEAKQSIRSPICVVMGHVDHGKTKILDKIRSSKIGENEVGHITQQIGATFIPAETIAAKSGAKMELQMPGLLVIDTPGHEAFSNLRSRGSSLCDIAILVVSITDGLMPQTFESLEMLKQRRVPFVVAMNMVDRLYDWEATPWSPIQATLKKQKGYVQQQFNDYANRLVAQFGAECGLNANLYWKMKKKDFKDTAPVVPTSAITGEGLPDLMALLVQLTQTRMASKLSSGHDLLDCTVLEVKKTKSYGTTLDVILVNGALHRNDTIVIGGMEGPIVTRIKTLLTPAAMIEMRSKSKEYDQLDEVHGARGVRLVASGLEHAMAGSQLYVADRHHDIEQLKDAVMGEWARLMSKIHRQDRGVFVMASTLGSLEALLDFLTKEKIPVAGIAVGDIHKKHVMQAGAMLESEFPEFACILAFNVKLDHEAERVAREMGVTIFMEEIIYTLQKRFQEHWDSVKKARQRAAEVSFPVLMDIMPEYVIRQKNPIILGCKIREGKLRLGTPIAALVRKDDSVVPIRLGTVGSIQQDQKDIDKDWLEEGEEAAVRILAGAPPEPSMMYGRHFDHTAQLVSCVSRASIDHLKANFKDVLSQKDWQLIIKLKPFFNVI
jgi:translation initiation factor 5B